MSKQDFPKSAFPCMEFKTDEKGLVFGISHTGMTLRDWYAGMALQGVILNLEDGYDPNKHAKEAFEWADAMLKARGE